MLLCGFAVFFDYNFIFEPLKFRYFIYRVESARTASEEIQAFKLAANWGRVWEVNQLRAQDWPVGRERPQSEWLLDLEWLESSPFSGAGYHAYRGVIDTNNLLILQTKEY